MSSQQIDQIPVKDPLVSLHETCERVNQREILELTQTLAEQASLSGLPPSEPSIFDGDPLKYQTWKSAFQTLIEHKHIPLSAKIQYLRKYLSSSVKEVSEKNFLLTSKDEYEETKKLLEERYDGSFVVGNAIRENLEKKWLKIQAKDSSGLRRFADVLKSVKQQ